MHWSEILSDVCGVKVLIHVKISSDKYRLQLVSFLAAYVISFRFPRISMAARENAFPP